MMDKIEKRRAQNRLSYQRHRDVRLAKAREWRAENPERMKELNRRWYYEHHESALAARRVYREANKEKMRAYQKVWSSANPGRISALNRKRKTGCTPEQYAVLLENQHGLCAICQRRPGRMKLAADHCHVTKTVRGLLCAACNTAIGMFGERIELLWTAIRYLEQTTHVSEVSA